MSEKLDPEEVTEIVNQFFAVLTEPIYRFGGVVDKYIGDAIMALFGAPIAHEDDPERAMAAAWEMQKAAGTFADRLESRTGIRLRIRIGLNTGLVVAGAVGGAQKQDYTVLGDAVNLASRLESNAKPGGILVSEETYRQTVHLWDFDALPPLKVKGKEEPIPVFEPRGPRQPTDADEAKERPAFVGRRHERRRLDALLESARAGKPQFVSLVGDAGMGKSRLAREFYRSVRETSVTVLRGRCLSYQQGVAYALVASILRAWMSLRDDSADGLRQQLAVWAQSLAIEDPERLAEVLGTFLSLPLKSPDLLSLTPEQFRTLALRTLNDLVFQQAGEGMILALNDLHWVDEASQAWLRSFLDEVATRREPLPLMILAILRPEGEEPWLDSAQRLDWTRIPLQPLGPDEAEAILRSLYDLPGDLSPEMSSVLEEATRKAEGNPFFLCELFRSLGDLQLIRQDESGAWRLTQRDVALPGTIQGVVAARLDALSPATKQALQVASVLGRDFDLRLLEAVCATGSLASELDELLAAELIRRRPGQADHFAFNQALIQEVAYQGLLIKRRRELHLRVGIRLEFQAQEGKDGAELAPMLAYHFLRAEDDARACRYLTEAGNLAKRLFSNQEACQNYLEALPLAAKLGLEQAPLLRDFAEVLATLGQFPEAQQRLEEALVSEHAPEHLAATYLQLGGVKERLGKYEEALASYERGLSYLPVGRFPAERARLLAAIALVELSLGKFQDAIERCQSARSGLDPSHAKEIALCHSIEGGCLWRLGRPTDARDCHLESLALRERIQDLIGIGSCHNNLSQAYRDLGEASLAMEHCRKALDTYRKTGDQSRMATALLNLGAILTDMGDLDRALDVYEEALEICRRIRYTARLGVVLCNLGEVETKRNRLEAAREHLTEGIAMLERINNQEALIQAKLIMSETHLKGGSLPEAWEILKTALELAKERGNEVLINLAYRQFGWLYLQTGRHDEAIAWLGRSANGLQTAGAKLELGRTLLKLAQALAQARKLPPALAAARRAKGLFLELGAHYDASLVDACQFEASPLS
jgi:class 3 adenylate cyclase/predicted ATPase